MKIAIISLCISIYAIARLKEEKEWYEYWFHTLEADVFDLYGRIDVLEDE